MEKLSDDLIEQIWSEVYNTIFWNEQNIRLVCRHSEKIFQTLIQKKTRYNCRESLCQNILKERCFLGRYCCCSCYYEHISGY